MAENSLSVCLITKNSENYLEKCLESVMDIAAEIIINDTGSTDRTAAIIFSLKKKYSNKIFFFQTTWSDDFSLARNDSLNKASGEWILVLDSDQVLAAESKPLIKKIISEENNLACYLNTVTNSGLIGKQLRLFRNGQGIHYQGIVHEQIYQSVNSALQKNPSFQVIDSKISVIEYGYEQKKDLLEKNERNLGLLKKAISDQSLDNLSRTYYLTKMATKIIKENETEALAYFQEVFRLAKSLKKEELIKYKHFQEAYENIVWHYLNKKETTLLNDYLQEGLKYFPGSPKLNFFSAIIAEIYENLAIAKFYYQKTINYLKEEKFIVALNNKKILQLCEEGLKRINNRI